MTELRWDEIDKRAVDTARVLAADAVEKVGNGHPGTAMSLAPAAYLLYQRVMKHDPADTHWPGRDRFILSCGHSSLTQYIQLYLGGFGLELDEPQAHALEEGIDLGHVVAPVQVRHAELRAAHLIRTEHHSAAATLTSSCSAMSTMRKARSNCMPPTRSGGTTRRTSRSGGSVAV